MVKIPEEFLQMLHHLLGDEASLLIESLNLPPVTSIRLNRRKTAPDFPEVYLPGNEFPGASPVPWCQSGYYLPQRPDFILDPLLHAGAYYVQDASSMIYETITKILVDKFPQNSRNNLKILDLCAAPGGKTTAMINALPDSCHVTANEYSSKRVGPLKENLDRWGFENVTVTNRDSSFYALQGENFDLVAVDAPCSGEGMMRKEEIARSQWSPQLVNQCATLQKEILENAVRSLKPGGFLIYSTCTFNRQENEENAEYIKEKLGLIPVDPEFPEEWNIPNGINTSLPVKRFMPHKTKGEGLFLAIFQKPGIWAPSIEKTSKIFIDKGSKNKVTSEISPQVNVDKETALKYLRRESIILSPEAPHGLVTIAYKGLPLGPAKNIGVRANNLFPKNRRILKR